LELENHDMGKEYNETSDFGRAEPLDKTCIQSFLRHALPACPYWQPCGFRWFTPSALLMTASSAFDTRRSRLDLEPYCASASPPVPFRRFANLYYFINDI